MGTSTDLASPPPMGEVASLPSDAFGPRFVLMPCPRYRRIRPVHTTTTVHRSGAFAVTAKACSLDPWKPSRPAVTPQPVTSAALWRTCTISFSRCDIQARHDMLSELSRAMHCTGTTFRIQRWRSCTSRSRLPAPFPPARESFRSLSASCLRSR